MGRKRKSSHSRSKNPKPSRSNNSKRPSQSSVETSVNSSPQGKAGSSIQTTKGSHPSTISPSPAQNFHEKYEFLRAIALVGVAVLRCWPALIISILLGYLLFQTGQGFEVVLNGLLAPNHTGAWIFGFAICYFATWSVQYTDEFLVGWRANETDRFTAFARFEAPIIVALANPLIFVLLMTNIPNLSPAELDDFRVNSAACIFALLIAPVIGRFFTITDYKKTTLRERRAFILTVFIAFIVIGDIHQRRLYKLADIIVTWVIFVSAVLVIDWSIVARVQPITFHRSKMHLLSQAVITMIFVLILGIALMSHTMTFSQLLGSPVILLFAVAFWTSVSCLTALLVVRRGARVRIVTIAGAVCLIGLLFTGPYNEAAVRRIAASNYTKTSLTVPNYVRNWLDARRDEIKNTPGTYPVVIVAAEGGGIRAAYWAAGILTRIHDHPGWGDHLIAISGVSGGAVGAGVFAGLIAASQNGGVACHGDGRLLYPCVRAVFSADLLSPPLAYMLMNDFVRSIFRLSQTDERTAALEQALEQAFGSATGSSILREGFPEPWREGNPKELPPLIVSNMTIAGGGERAVLAPFKGEAAFKDAIDITDFVQPERLRMSTATILSARFPLISATGVIDGGSNALKLVDGGYADNSGSATAMNLVESLIEAAEQDGLREKIVPVVLPIKNGAAQVAGIRSQIERGLIGSIIDPLATLDGVRATSASRYESDLSKYMASIGGVIVKGFELKYDEDRFPLGWSLGLHSVQRLDQQINGLFTGEPGNTLSVLFAHSQ